MKTAAKSLHGCQLLNITVNTANTGKMLAENSYAMHYGQKLPV